MSPQDYQAWMRAAAEHTRPDEAAVARVGQRLAQQLVPTTELLKQVPGPDAGAAARVAARLSARPQPGVPWGKVAPLAALLLGAVGVGLWWSGAEPVLEQLESRLVLDGREVGLLEGEGAAALVDGAMTVDWVVGRLELGEVGVPVSVITREAVARSEAGDLVVVRDALGSQVVAGAGAASVACAGAAETLLAPGASTLCVPSTAAGMLGRALALSEQGAVDDAVQAVAAGLRMEPAAAVAVELHGVGVDLAMSAGDVAGAVAHAEEALGLGGGARVDELHRVAARGWLLAGDCGRALPHLEELQVLEPEEAAHRERCLAAE
jgi:hypothetical protein